MQYSPILSTLFKKKKLVPKSQKQHHHLSPSQIKKKPISYDPCFFLF